MGVHALTDSFCRFVSVFLMDLDNEMFYFALGEKTRTRIEDAGRVRLAESEHKMLLQSKVVHVCLVAATVIGTVYLLGNNIVSGLSNGPSWYTFGTSLLLPFGAFWLGGVTEGIVLGACSWSRVLRCIAKSTIGFLLGMLAWSMIFVYTFYS